MAGFVVISSCIVFCRLDQDVISTKLKAFIKSVLRFAIDFKVTKLLALLVTSAYEAIYKTAHICLFTIYYYYLTAI